MSARDITLSSIRTQTYLQNKRVEQAKKLVEDPQRAERLVACMCVCCFYIPRVGGAAMTSWDCGMCDFMGLHSSTAAPILCLPCAERRKLCRWCGADIDLRLRAKLEADETPV